MDTRTRSIRVLMFPWLAHGHISPFLQLAKSLAKRNFITYICSSPINLNSIKRNISPKDSISIKLVELQIPTTSDLPPHYHTTNGLPPHLMATLKKALDEARPAFSTLLKTLRPDLVIYDFLQRWAPEEAASQNIPAVVFLSTGAAASSLIMYSWFEPRVEYPFSSSIYFRENENEIFSRMVKSAGSDSDDPIRIRDCVKRSCDVVLIKTFRELEGKYIDFFSELTHKIIVPVGPLVQELDNITEENEHKDIMRWLDEKDIRSTVFASFGSEYFLSENDVEEIAYGLAMSRVNFILVLRVPKGENITIEQKLPKGFRQTVGERGIVVEGWAPQRTILSHKNIGGFLSHCGWSSVMEGLYSGLPIIAVPMNLDQPLNARLVEEVGLGMEVVRNRGGELERDEVARVVEKVVVERSGEELRRSAAVMREKIIEKGEEEIDGVVKELVSMCLRKERLNLESENSIERLNVLTKADTMFE